MLVQILGQEQEPLALKVWEKGKQILKYLLAVLVFLPKAPRPTSPLAKSKAGGDQPRAGVLEQLALVEAIQLQVQE